MAKNCTARVASICQGTPPSEPLDQLIRFTMERLDLVAPFKPDIVCLPEMWAGNDPEPLSGPTTRRVSEWAKAHGCYAISSVHADIDGKRYNTAVLIDRGGDIVGTYHKMYPTEGELDKGILPGPYAEPPVFELDFGVIGIQICFDVNWPESWTALKRRGAQVVFWTSAFAGSERVRMLARANEMYVATSTRGGRSRIYDITGRVIDRSGQFRQWTTATLALDKRLFEIDFHIPKAREIEQKYGERIHIEWLHEDDGFTLESRDPDLSVQDVIDEFGLIPLREYLARCESRIEEARDA